MLLGQAKKGVLTVWHKVGENTDFQVLGIV